MYYFKYGQKFLKVDLRRVAQRQPMWGQPTPAQGTLFLKRDNAHEYQYLKTHPEFRGWTIKVYDFNMANLAHYFNHNPDCRKVWYCTFDRFDLVEAIKAPPLLPPASKVDNRYTRFLKDYNFVIRNSYLDQHPLDCYIKLCGLLNLNPNKKDLKLFSLSFAPSSQIDTGFYRPINQLNKKVLEVEQLKLSKLKRVKFTDPVSRQEAVEREEILASWRKPFSTFERYSDESLDDVIKAVSQSQLFQEHSYESYLQRCQPRKTSYGVLQPQKLNTFP